MINQSNHLNWNYSICSINAPQICQTDSLTYRLFLICWYGLESWTTRPYNITGKIKYVYQPFRLRYRIVNLYTYLELMFSDVELIFLLYIFIYQSTKTSLQKVTKRLYERGSQPPTYQYILAYYELLRRPLLGMSVMLSDQSMVSFGWTPGD